MWITRDTILRGNDIVLCANVLAYNDGTDFFILVRWVARYDVAMTSSKMMSLNLNTFKDYVSKKHKFA